MDYAERALTLHGIVRDLHAAIMWAGRRGTANRSVVIDTTVLTVNKLLHSYAIDADLAEWVDQYVNQAYVALRPRPNEINQMFCRCIVVVRTLLNVMQRWVDRYAERLDV